MIFLPLIALAAVIACAVLLATAGASSDVYLPVLTLGGALVAIIWGRKARKK